MSAPDPQQPLLNRLTDDELLNCLGPSWARMSAARAALSIPVVTAPTLRTTGQAAEERGAKQGEPSKGVVAQSLAQLLKDPDALKPPTAVIPRLAWRGRVTLLTGREKLGGKSTLLTAGAAALTRGARFLDGACEAGSILWVSADQEHPSEIVQRAVRFGADPERFFVLWPQQPFIDLCASLERLNPFPSLLVVDTLASFARGIVTDPHSSAEWPQVLVPLLRYARKLEMAVAIPHHAKKGEGGGYRDSTAIGALVDMLLELTPDAASAARRNVSALGRWPVSGFSIELVGDQYQLVAGELSLDARVLAFVQSHQGCSKVDVRSAVGARSEDVDATLGQLIDRGAIHDAGTDRRHAYVAGPKTQTEALDGIPF